MEVGEQCLLVPSQNASKVPAGRRLPGVLCVRSGMTELVPLSTSIQDSGLQHGLGTRERHWDRDGFVGSRAAKSLVLGRQGEVIDRIRINNHRASVT